MAGGKETPRQKMIGMMYLVLTALLALNVSKSILDAFVAIEANIQKANETEFYRGNEKYDGLKETAQDKSEAERAAKAARLLKTVDKIDAMTAKRIKTIDGLKMQILAESGEDVTSVGEGFIMLRPYSDKDGRTALRPAKMDLDKVAGKDKYDDAMRIMIGDATDIKKPSGKGMDLWKDLNAYRTELVEAIAGYDSGDSATAAYFFKAPSINKFADQQDLSKQVKAAIKKSNVAQDDIEAITKIYASLTKEEYSKVHGMDNVHWIGKTFDHSPAVAAIASLSSMQKEILTARADAVALIRSRVSGGEYSFNKIMALAYGPELANAGDEIEVQVLMAAYDSDKQPVVTMGGTTITDVKEGKGHIKTRASGSSEMTLSGEITIRNKSGVAKMMPWQKTIKIMKPSGTVSLPELNVLYRGYANKVEAVASGYDQTILSGSGVSLTKSGSGWIANPGGGREATITVSGKSSVTNKTVSLGAFKFRISRLPDPELFFGTAPSGERGSKSETRLFAKYKPEIPLNAKFSILRWELSVPGNPTAPPRGQGGQLTPTASSLLRQVKPGTIISIMTDVRGPDGVTRKRGGSWKYNIMKSLFLSLIAIGSVGVLFAQPELNGGPVNVPADGIVDGVYIKEHVPTKKMIPYEYVREADVIWSKRAWEYIDLREKINHPLYYPLDEITANGTWIKHAERWSLWTVIRQHVMNGDLRLFSPFSENNLFGERDGDQLKYPVDPQPGMNFYTDSAYREKLVYYFGKLGPQSDQPLSDEFGEPKIIIDKDGFEAYEYPPRDTVWFSSKDIIQYRIKEDWFFDKERSVLDVRIIAIAPVVNDIEEQPDGTKIIRGTKELFWLYFPHCRFVFNNYLVFNERNDAQWMSYDDLFWKRRFNATVYKESGVFDRKIETYRTGIDALMESQKIKEGMRTIEHDVWNF